jgi:hypothetical protein
VYELQERCGKRAQEVFNKEYGNGNFSKDGKTFIITYTNHYNRRLNKCFVILKAISFSEKKDKLGMLTDKTLWDINEMKQYGSFDQFFKGELFSCQVLDKGCNSEIEWDSLVKSYMED